MRLWIVCFVFSLSCASCANVGSAVYVPSGASSPYSFTLSTGCYLWFDDNYDGKQQQEEFYRVDTALCVRELGF